MTTQFAIHKIIRVMLLFAAAVFAIPSAFAANGQAAPSTQNSMPGMDMSQMAATPGQNSDAATAATGAMSGEDMHGMNMDAHMYMTDLRPSNAADQQRAAEILAQLRPAIEKYKDYHVALADGFRIFGPNVPQPIYHFTKAANAIKAQFTFDPARPTSLLYKKTSTGYELVGAMYTAPRRYSEDELNARVPLSVARWHKHINLCLPPRGTRLQQIDFKEFGPTGSIATQQSCDAAGGRWYSQIFGWMVHVYPFETSPNNLWAH